MRQDREGFTLIELLVVIAIIAILAAILFPVFTSSRDKGRQAACMSNQKQLGSALVQYVDDNGGTFPTVNMAIAFGPSYDWEGAHPFGVFYQLERYLKNKGVLKCPSAVPDPRSPKGRSQIGYFINGDGTSWKTLCGGYFPAFPNHVSPAAKMSEIRRPSRVIAVQDKCLHSPSGDIHPGWFGLGNSDNFWYNARPTHLGGLTMSFADGHAKWIKTEGIAFFKANKWQSTYEPGHISWDVNY